MTTFGEINQTLKGIVFHQLAWVECFRTVLFNLCDDTHKCGWENRAVRMTNTVRTSADEKTLLCCCKRILNNPLFIYHPVVFCKTWYCAQRKISRHYAHILIVWTSQHRNAWEVTESCYETFISAMSNPRPACGLVDGFVPPNLGFRCSKSILHDNLSLFW